MHSAVVNGWKEMADDMSLNDTLALAKTLDRIRWQVGLIYPQDKGTLGVQSSESGSSTAAF